MRTPDSLVTLFDYGVIDDVVRPLMSGKEAQVYLVISGGKYAVAKIYKESQNRTFKHRAEYTEGRKVRNTRDQRAIDKRSKHGRQQDEAAWRSTEVDMIHRLHAAGVRVPIPYHFIDGVLVMELITDADGNPAPRLGDLALDRDTTLHIYQRLIREVQRMLCAGVVHGDLSEFNVLVGADGPVIIDFPQSVDTAQNMGAKKLLLRDVDNLHRFLTRLNPTARRPPYAQEMWHLYEQNLLTPETELRGDYRPVERKVNTSSVLELIDDAARDERKRRDSLGLRGGPREPQPRAEGPRDPRPQNPSAQRNVQPQNQSLAARRAAPVYQGLPNEGLSAWGRRTTSGGHKGSRQHANPQHQQRQPSVSGQRNAVPGNPSSTQRPQNPNQPGPQQGSRHPAPQRPSNQANPHHAQGNSGQGSRRPDNRGQSNNGQGQTSQPNNGFGNRGQDHRGQDHRGQGNSGQGSNGHANSGQGNNGQGRDNRGPVNQRQPNPRQGHNGDTNQPRHAHGQAPGNQRNEGSRGRPREPEIERIPVRSRPNPDRDARPASPPPSLTRETQAEPDRRSQSAPTPVESEGAEPRKRRVIRRVTTPDRSRSDV